MTRDLDTGPDITQFYQYDNLLRLDIAQDGNGDQTQYEYDRVHNQTQIQDAENSLTEYEYDEWDRLKEEKITVGGNEYTRTWQYDHEDNVEQHTDRNGRLLSYTYDDNDRLTLESWLAGGVTENVIATNWDIVDRTHSRSDTFSSYTYAYDNQDRLTSVSNISTPGTPTVALTHQYDSLGRRRSTASTLDGTADFYTQHDFNSRNFVTDIKQTSQAGGNSIAYKRVDLNYDDADQLDYIGRLEKPLTQEELVGYTILDYDLDERLERITHKGEDYQSGTVTLAEYDWTYDSAGRVQTFTSLADGTVTYTYDQRSQLTDADYDSGWAIADEHYRYDANGNRTDASFGLPPEDPNATVLDYHTPQAAHNRISSDGVYDYAFDQQGNRIRRTHSVNDTVTVYEYDTRNRLTTVSEYASTADANAGTNATQVVEHIYDLDNRWIGKQVDTDGDTVVDVTERYVYHGGQIVYRFVDKDDAGTSGHGEAEANELKSRYLWGPAIDQILAEERLDDTLELFAPGNVYWPLTDNLGTVRDLAWYDALNDETKIVAHRAYESFGRLASATNPSGVNPEDPNSSDPVDHFFGFTGKPLDEHTGLQQNWHRWYDSATGQWMTTDPIEDDRTNTYRYVGNSPTNAIDPTGLEEFRWATHGHEEWYRWLQESDDSPDTGLSIFDSPAALFARAGKDFATAVLYLDDTVTKMDEALIAVTTDSDARAAWVDAREQTSEAIGCERSPRNDPLAIMRN